MIAKNNLIMLSKDEMDRFLSNPGNRLLIDLNTLKTRYKNVFREMDKVKNINFIKAVPIVLKYEFSKHPIVVNSEKEFHEAAMGMSALVEHLVSMYKWKRWKKIYNFNDELIAALNVQSDRTDPDTLSIPMNFLRHLPYETFFISADKFINDIIKETGDDVLTCKQFSTMVKGNIHVEDIQIDGFFVKIDIDYRTKKNVLSFNIPVKLMYFIDQDGDPENINSYSLGPSYIWNYEMVLDGDTIGDCIKLSLDDRDASINIVSKNPEQNVNSYKKIIMRCLTYLMYILSTNSDIIDGSNETYKPKKKKESIIDAISEVQQFNVGYRIGAALKHHRLHTNIESTEYNKKKVPHTRRGHWHHYWTGPRNSNKRELIVHWIPPIAINSNWEIENPIVEITPIH